MDLSAIKAEYETTAKKCLLERDTVCERLAQDDFSPRPPRILFCPPFALRYVVCPSSPQTTISTPDLIKPDMKSKSYPAMSCASSTTMTSNRRPILSSTTPSLHWLQCKASSGNLAT